MAFDPKIARKEQEYISLDKRTCSFDEVNIPFNEEDIILQSKRCLSCAAPECVKGCPLSLPIPTLIKLVSENRKAEAYKMLNDISPISTICAIVCDHEGQCEGHCIRNRNHQPVTIGAIHRYIASLDLDYKPTLKEDNGKKVAIIGAGPSGISAAIELRKLGYNVTIYEKEAKLGGVPYYGIPSFRLSDKDLARTYKGCLDLGINFIFNKEVSVNDIVNDMMQSI